MTKLRGLSVYTVIFAFCLLGVGAFAEKDTGSHLVQIPYADVDARPVKEGTQLQFPCKVASDGEIPQVEIIPINDTSPVDSFFQRAKKSEIVLGVEDTPFGTREQGEVHGVGDLYSFAAIQIMGVHMATSSIAREMDAIGNLTPEQLEKPQVEKQAHLRLRQLRSQMGYYASELSRILISNPELAQLGKVAAKGESEEGILNAIQLLTEQQTEDPKPVKAEDFGLAVKAVAKALSKDPSISKRFTPEISKGFAELIEDPQDAKADELFGKIYQLQNEQIAKNVMRMFCHAQEKGKSLVILVPESALNPADGIQTHLKPAFSREKVKLVIQPLLEAAIPEVEIFDPSLTEEEWKALMEKQEKISPSSKVSPDGKSRTDRQKKEDDAVDDLIRKLNQK